MTIIDDIQFDDDDSDNTHAYDDDHSVLRLVTVVCWLEQTCSPVDFCVRGRGLALRRWRAGLDCLKIGKGEQAHRCAAAAVRTGYAVLLTLLG